MGFKKILFGEPMPDKNDPHYKERYERDFEAGRKFADKAGISWLAMQVQRIANAHRKGFLVVVFGFVLSCFIYNVVGLVLHFRASQERRRAMAVERVDALMTEINQLKKSRSHDEIYPQD